CDSKGAKNIAAHQSAGWHMYMYGVGCDVNAFVDEIDSIAPKREKANGEERRAVSQHDSGLSSHIPAVPEMASCKAIAGRDLGFTSHFNSGKVH
ncbi:hypothetical protein LTR53_016572, partial [Teratosphaeriaceae sp. CCFEE 6253]